MNSSYSWQSVRAILQGGTSYIYVLSSLSWVLQIQLLTWVAPHLCNSMTPYHRLSFSTAILLIGQLLQVHTFFTQTSSMHNYIKLFLYTEFLPFFAHLPVLWPFSQLACQCCQCENSTPLSFCLCSSQIWVHCFEFHTNYWSNIIFIPF